MGWTGLSVGCLGGSAADALQDTAMVAVWIVSAVTICHRDWSPRPVFPGLLKELDGDGAFEANFLYGCLPILRVSSLCVKTFGRVLQGRWLPCQGGLL